MTTQASRRYSIIAIILHWIIAALILANIGLAWWFGSLHGAARSAPIQLHKSFGITVLALTVLRIGWRLANPPSPMPAGVRGWERQLARLTHALFYVVMIAMPLSGWIFTSAATPLRPTMLYGAVPLPVIEAVRHGGPARTKQVHDLFAGGHGALAKLAYLLIVLHVGGALRHLLLLRDGVVGRMVPFLKAPA
ncbi:MAG TPA: cytochrome b/b6 domain-containing protein [Caulobacteraceae bacterium]|jgi:cytochrome b561|nr:cytochrome b/b6 domain-containing protein [Caulobacteraceae bacterium]